MEPILGHTPTLERLWSAVSRDSLHHAYLFEGPRGVGKRLVATRLAMAANCEAAGERPCGACATCRQIEAGQHPDVLVLEPDTSRASATIGVDQVRELIRQAGYHRYAARRRVVIVDPAEAMQESAANALLKTLEEPPAGTGFVLVSHNASGLLPTILSRCQRLRFGAVPEEQMVPWLEARGVAEAVTAARLAQGCPGRALALGEAGLQERAALRSELLDVLGRPLGDIYAFSQKVCQGRRQDWTPRAEALLEVVEDLLRDVVVRGSGAELPLVNAGGERVVDAWTAALWPDGVQVCARAVQDARDDLAVYVTGKTAIDALLTTLRHALGPAPR